MVLSGRIELPASSLPMTRSTTELRQQMVGLGRLELPTSRLSGERSNQLSYRPSTLCITQVEYWSGFCRAKENLPVEPKKFAVVPTVRFELTTFALREHCSTTELRRQSSVFGNLIEKIPEAETVAAPNLSRRSPDHGVAVELMPFIQTPGAEVSQAIGLRCCTVGAVAPARLEYIGADGGNRTFLCRMAVEDFARLSPNHRSLALLHPDSSFGIGPVLADTGSECSTIELHLRNLCTEGVPLRRAACSMARLILALAAGLEPCIPGFEIACAVRSSPCYSPLSISLSHSLEGRCLWSTAFIPKRLSGVEPALRFYSRCDCYARELLIAFHNHLAPVDRERVNGGSFH